MKRKILTLFLAVCAAMCLCFGLVACGEGKVNELTHTHSYETTWSYDDEYHWHVCTASAGYCDANVKDMAEHTFSGGVCTVCHYDRSLNELHTHSLTHTEANVFCDQEGNIEYWYCSECGRYFSNADATREINDTFSPPMGHDYVDGVCSRCGYLEIYNLLKFVLFDDETSYYVGSCDTDATEIVIPSTYCNKPVTFIGSFAFQDCSSLKSVTIGNGVTYIGIRAFRNCTALTRIEIPDSVESIGGYAFTGCTSLTSVSHKNRQRINLTKAAIQ